MERLLMVAVGVAHLEDAVPPALARQWRARPVRPEALDVLGTAAPAVEFRRSGVAFPVVVVEDPAFGPVTLLAHDATNEALVPRKFHGAAFQRACAIGYPAVLELLEVLRVPRGRWSPRARSGAEAVAV